MKTLPAWGLTAEIPATATAAFGARTVLKNGIIDWVPDRGEWQAEVVEDKKTMMTWVRRVGEPWLSKEARHLRGNEATLVSLDDDRCHMRANTNASPGYLYVAAWIDGEQS